MAPFRFFIYSNLFIAVCAVLMVGQSYQLLLHTAPDTYFLAFVFFSTICSYSFHWYLSTTSVLASPRIEWQQRNQYVYPILFIAGLIGAVIFFLCLIMYWPCLLISAFITFLYSAPKIPDKHFRALRKIALGKTIFLAMVWTFVTTVLPVIVSGRSWQIDFYFFVVSRFFMIYAVCILFDYRDREHDKAKGIRSLITFLNESSIRNLFFFSILVFLVSTLCMLCYDYSLLTVFILLLPGIITAALYHYAQKNFSDMFYYFVLDGLMALSALLTLLIGI